MRQVPQMGAAVSPRSSRPTGKRTSRPGSQGAVRDRVLSFESQRGINYMAKLVNHSTRRERSLVCPSCAAKLRAPDNLTGRKMKCPKCGTAIIVPGPIPEAPEAVRAEPMSQAVTRVEPPVPFPSPSEQPERKQSRAGFWIGLGAGAFVLVLATIGATVCAKGFVAPTSYSASGLTQKQRSGGTDAIKALERIKAAVEVGVDIKRYSELVGDAKAAVNEAERTLPRDEFLTNLSEA